MVNYSGARILAEVLKAEGIKYVFGLPGGQSCSILYDGLYDVPEITPILVRHEEAAAFMAYAYARLTGQPSVCTGTVGPGAQHLVAGIAEAWAGCIPIIAIAPQVSTEIEGKGALQEFPQVPMFAPFTKWSMRIPRVDRLTWYVRRAFQIATTGQPGPVFLEIPDDVGSATTSMPPYTPSIHPLRFRPSQDQVQRAGKLILRAERPLIVAGGGIYLSRAFEALQTFAELLAIPILTSAGGKGSIEEDHPLAVGCTGMYRTPIGKKLWDEADLIIGVGTRFEEVETGSWIWFPKGAKLIHVDVDPTSIGRNWIPDVPVIGDAKLALTDLADYCAERIGKLQFQEIPRVQSILKMKQEFENDLDRSVQSDSSSITVLQILREARKIFDRDAILVHENGSLDTWSYSYFPVLAAGMDVIPAGQTCMGFGVAGVIGAKLALPRQQAVCVTGDGAFQMMMDNLSVAVQYDVSPTWIVLNNRSLGWIKWWQHQYYRDRYISVDFDAQPDFTKIAEAHKCFGRHVDHPGAVVSSLEAAIEANRNGIPAVLDFTVNTFDHYPSFIEFHNLLS